MEILNEAGIRSHVKSTISLILYSDMNADLPTFTIYYNVKNLNTDYRIVEGKPRVFTRIKEDLWRAYRTGADASAKDEYTKLGGIAGRLRLGSFDYDEIIAEFGSTIHKYNKIFTLRDIKDKKSLYQFLCVDNGFQPTAFKKFFGEIEEPTGEATPDSNKTEFKGLNVYFPTGMRESRKSEFMRVLEDLKNLYTKHGLGKAISGDIKFTKTGHSALGTYFIPSAGNKGYIKIDPASKNLHRLLYVLIHEFGHKIYYELIPSKISEIEKLFRERGGIDAARKRKNGGYGGIGNKIISRLELNDWLTAEKGNYVKISKRWKIIQTSPKFVIESEFVVPGLKAGKMHLSGPDIEVFLSNGFKPEKTEVIDIERVAYSHQYSEIQKKVTEEFFSTGYAEINPAEWFAETVTMYMIGALDGEIKDIIEKYLSAAK